MRFEVLGPLRVAAGDSDKPRALSAARLRTLLAVLLWRANQPVPADELAEMVWDGAPPAGAPEATRALVMRLRRHLDTRVAARIVTCAPGYVIEVSDGELDVSRFETLAREASAAVRACRWAQSARSAAAALELWRGTPLADVPSQMLRDQWGPYLDQLREQTLEWRIEGDLHEGRHEQLIPELKVLTTRHPLREHIHGQLMLALYRCGRQAEALAAYRRARDILVEELGVEPGPVLRDLHQRILSGDAAPADAEAARPATGEHRLPVPRELPPAVPGFTGRSAELRTLTSLLGRACEPASETMLIAVIGGTAGVGKTALAVHWAHSVVDRFPDGQLYVNLRGYDPGPPMAPADALAAFLRALGVAGQDIPPEADERAARYRSLLAGKRVLVILDNARSAGQVRPLLPGTSACTVLVTSRDALSGLVAREGATRLDLDVLPQREAVSLLRTLIGARVDAEPGAAAELAGQCCRLPLALRVAAELAASRPAVPLAALAVELADMCTRLDLLAAGEDTDTRVRTVFSWSYRHLDAGDARAFRLLGLHPGPDFEPYAAAALTDLTAAQARQALDALAHAHLIQHAAPGRYGMHDLLRAYARELSATVDGAEKRHAALTRLFDHYLHTAAAAMDIFYPAERHRRPRIPRTATPVPPLPDPAAAREWLDDERPALVAAVVHTVAHGWPGHATRLAVILFRYLESAGHYAEMISINTHARRAARDVGDRTAEAEALNNITLVDLHQGRYEQAGSQLEQALALYQESGNSSGEARALGTLGILRYQQGRYQHAIGYQQRSLRLRRHIHDQAGEANTLNNLGLTQTRQGSYAEATDHLEQALALYQKTGDRKGEAHAQSNLGHMNALQADYQQAADRLDQALALFRDTGDPVGEADALNHLGELSLLLGCHPQACDHHRQAAELSRKIGDPSSEAEALNGLGQAFLARGQPCDAHAHHATALELADRIGDRYQEARAHFGLARAHRAAGRPGRARIHLERALTLYTRLGTPEAEDVRAQLIAVGISSWRAGCDRGRDQSQGEADADHDPADEVDAAVADARVEHDPGDDRAPDQVAP